MISSDPHPSEEMKPLEAGGQSASHRAGLIDNDVVPPGLVQAVAALVPPTTTSAALSAAVARAARRATGPCQAQACDACHLQWTNRESSCEGRRWRMFVKHLLHGLLPRLRRGCSLTEARAVIERATEVSRV